MSKYAGQIAQRDRESARLGARLDRSPEIRDICATIADRIVLLQSIKADKMTEPELWRTIDALMLALQHINALHERQRIMHRFLGGK
jgi:hypothetical protein